MGPHGQAHTVICYDVARRLGDVGRIRGGSSVVRPVPQEAWGT